MENGKWRMENELSVLLPVYPVNSVVKKLRMEN